MVNPARLVSLTVLALCLGGASPSLAEWRRVDSPNFVVIGDISARDLRDIAVKFEAFRQTLSRVLTERAISTAVPTVVIVFPHDRAFTPFKPKFQGKTIEVGGLFVPRHDINYIAIVSDGQPWRLPIVFHEYAHLVISNAGRSVPVWLGEGLAEYYSTFDLSHDRREALLGLVPENRLEHLNETTMLPLDTLLTVDHDSPLYNEGNRRSTFYAQAWALTHLLLQGNPSRTPQLVAYLDNLSQGVAPKQAWQQAFGSQDLARELQTYVRQQAFRATRYRFAEQLATFDAAAAAMAPAEVQAYLAEFLIHQQRFNEAADRLAAGAKIDAGNVRLGTATVLLDIVKQDVAAADARARALAKPQDWLAAYLAGIALADLTERQAGRPAPERIDAARTYFGIARASRPEFPNALARMADIELRGSGVPSADVRAAIARARALAPGRHDYTLLHAQVLARQSEFATARAVLGPLLSSQYPKDVRESARSLMARIVEVESARLVKSGGVAGVSTTAPVERPGTDLLSTPTSRPVFRQLRPGEERLEGTLERIDCGAGPVVFHLSTTTGRTTVTAARLNEVEFITYRSDLTGSVECGGFREPLPVIVTWRPAPGAPAARIVVAIEFPPKSPERAAGADCRSALPAGSAEPQFP
jgi:hypothetical protein